MASMNKVFLAGNLTRDPELRYTSGGAPVADIDIAVNRTYLTKSGEPKQEVCYVRVVIWGKQAELCKNNLGKGGSVLVEGRLQLDTWETKEGEKRKQLKVHAERIQFLSRITGKSQDDSKPAIDEPADETEIVSDNLNPDEDIPF